VATPSVVVVLNTTTQVSSDHNSHTVCFFFIEMVHLYFKVFYNSGFTRTLCGGQWQALSGSESTSAFTVSNLGSSTARVGCCPINSFMSNPFVAFLEADSCTACPSNALTTIANDDITCTNNVCPTGMVYLDTFYGCVKKLPNGDGATAVNAGTLRGAVSDWIAGGTLKSSVVATYGPIEDWDVSEVTNMKSVFYGSELASTFGSFNADLSKWNTSAATNMKYSKCTLSLTPFCLFVRCCVVLKF
jgi:surface protein